MFAFHGKINDTFRGPQEGEFHGEKRKAENNEWIYDNSKTILEKNDVIHYWIMVQHNNLGYIINDKQFVIRELIEKSNGDSILTHPTTHGTPFVTQSSLINSVTQRTNPVSTNTNCILSQTVVMGENVCEGTLIFEDNFDTGSLEKWKKENKISLDTEVSKFYNVCYNSILLTSFNSDPESEV